MGMFQTRGSNERYGVLENAVQRTLAAAGTTQATGTLIGANVSVITGASGANGVTLRQIKGNNPYTGTVYSNAASNALLVYPPVGGNFNNGTTNAAFSCTAQIPYTFTCISRDGLSWIIK